MNNNKVIGGILLVSGTAIGAGMLALPITTAKSGFIPGIFAFLLCWFFMTTAALLLLEVNLKLKGDRDLISMVDMTLGSFGKIIAWVSYLLLLYALISAYLTGGSAWIVKILADHHITVSPNWAILILILLYSLVVSYGTAATDKINRLLMMGLIFAYVVLVACAGPSVEMAKLGGGDLTHTPATFPLIITAFGFSIVLPSLTAYLNRDARALHRVVIVGSLLPFVIYLLWQIISLGIIPLTGENSLQMLAEQHDNGTGVTIALERIVGNPWITSSSQWFAVFAILTSLLGVSLALFHFLADGFKIKHKKTVLHRLLLSVLTYIPPLLLLLLYPSSFGRILSFAGIFVAVLMGIFPVMMVWRIRGYRYFTKSSSALAGYTVMGGQWLLISVFAFFLYIIYLEIANCFVCP